MHVVQSAPPQTATKIAPKIQMGPQIFVEVIWHGGHPHGQSQVFQAGVSCMLWLRSWGSVYPGVALSKPPLKITVELAPPR